MMLGSSWGNFALGLLALQVVEVSPSPAWTQAPIRIAAFCNQRSRNADKVLSLLSPQAPEAQDLDPIWSTPSLTLPLAGRCLAIQAQWVRWGLLGLGGLVAWGQTFW